MPEGTKNPAVIAAEEAEAEVARCLADRKSFLLEAGAGAGKTYSLVEVLKQLLTNERIALRKKNQKIACITYTNAATEVITRRIDNDSLVAVSTIHAFCWGLIRVYQPLLRQELAALVVWQPLLEESGGVGTRLVDYDLGYRKVLEDSISLHHDDVLTLTAKLMPIAKFQNVIANRYPYILVDEYQDTSSEMMSAITSWLVGRPGGPLIGLFGDHWQRIYEKTCGHIASPGLKEIGKKANFRSSVSVVNVPNRMRPELPQAVHDPDLAGTAVAFHTNSWKGTRRTGAGGGHWKGDVPADVAREFLRSCTEHLKADGWDFAGDKTKVLLLTHNGLAAEQGYAALADVFPYTDAYIKAANDYIAFFTKKIEPAIVAYVHRQYGKMFDLFGQEAPSFRSFRDKERWSAAMDRLRDLRTTGTVGEVLDHLMETKYPRLPDKVYRTERYVANFCPAEDEEIPKDVTRVQELRRLPYTQVLALTEFLEGHTPFATKHSVKGDEFENVLVVLGRGWNKYNFDQFLEQAGKPGTVSADKMDTFERNRNLFYVCCSRPKVRLALLFTQFLSSTSLTTLESWFGTGWVFDVGQGGFPSALGK